VFLHVLLRYKFENLKNSTIVDIHLCKVRFKVNAIRDHTRSMSRCQVSVKNYQAYNFYFFRFVITVFAKQHKTAERMLRKLRDTYRHAIIARYQDRNYSLPTMCVSALQVFETVPSFLGESRVILGCISDRHPRGFRLRVPGKPSNPDIRLPDPAGAQVQAHRRITLLRITILCSKLAHKLPRETVAALPEVTYAVDRFTVSVAMSGFANTGRR